MVEEFVTYQQAEQLKQLGFDWECNHSYYGHRSKDLVGFCTYHDFNKNGGPNECSAPTQTIAQKWLREVKKIEVNANYDNVKEKWYWFINDMQECCMTTIDDYNFDTFEQALSAGIDKVLDLLK